MITMFCSLSTSDCSGLTSHLRMSCFQIQSRRVRLTGTRLTKNWRDLYAQRRLLTLTPCFYNKAAIPRILSLSVRLSIYLQALRLPRLSSLCTMKKQVQRTPFTRGKHPSLKRSVLRSTHARTQVESSCS